MKMKKITYITILAITILLSVNSIFGQERNLVREQEEKDFQVLQEKIKQASLISKTASELQIKLTTELGAKMFGKRTVAFEAVKSGDTTVIPLLEIYADLGKYDADTALAKAGINKYLTKILKQTEKSEDMDTRYDAVRKLTLIGNKIAYKRLLELLDDTLVPVSSSNDYIYTPIWSTVMRELTETVSDPPNLKGIYDSDELRLIWKKWFDEHKELTEGAETPKCDVVNTPTAKPINKVDNSFAEKILFTDYLSIVLLNKLFQV
jgi:hypothetical protein